ncbi:MAG: (Fe-S)-binding protein [Thermoleophilia bacterium]
MGIEYVREYLPFLSHAATLIVMYTCVAVVVALFAWGFAHRFGRYRRAGACLWAAARSEGLPWGPRLSRAARDVVLQAKVVERRLPAALHLPIFYGTALLFVGTCIVVVYEDVLRWFGEFELGGLFYVLFEGVLDLAGLALVAGVGIALWRRLVQRPEHLTRKASTTLVLSGLLFMGLSGFGLEAYRIAAQPANEWAAAAFVGSLLAGLLEGWARADGDPVTAYQALWWLHAAGAFSLMVGLAWTGLSHVLVLPANVATHDPARPRTRLTTPFDLVAVMESEEDVELVAGTATTADIAPMERLAADACVACGRCHQECPAHAAGRALSPRDLVQDIRRSLGSDLGGAAAERPAADFEQAVWSCTNCYACEQACPARIRHVDYVLDFRRALVDQNRLDEQKQSVLQALDRNQNPYKLPSHERAAWVAELPYADEVVYGVAELGEPPEYLYWIGCAAAYDERTGAVARATMDLLRAAGVSFLTLGPSEPCCGEPAKRLGEEGRFQMIAMAAIEMIKETGARRIVTACPHGLNTFLHEYPGLGFTIPAVHHSELLAELVAAGRLKPGAGDGDGKLVYHEPCNLARAGRPAAAALGLLGGSAALPPRSGGRTFCCGGGGGNSFYQVEQEERRISALRYEELAATGAERLAVSCPFCLTMLRDAAAAQGERALPVFDVAELLRARLEEAATAADSAGSTR